MATNIYGSPIMTADEESDEDNDRGSNSETEVDFFSNPADMLSYPLLFLFPDSPLWSYLGSISNSNCSDMIVNSLANGGHTVYSWPLNWQKFTW